MVKGAIRPKNCILKEIAAKVLEAPSTSASVERSFSMQGWFQNKTKNRLSNKRAEKKTFIKYNLLLERTKKAKDGYNSDSEEGFIAIIVLHNQKNH